MDQYTIDRKHLYDGKCPECFMPYNAQLPEMDLSTHHPACTRCDMWFEIIPDQWVTRNHGYQTEYRQRWASINHGVSVNLNRDRLPGESKASSGIMPTPRLGTARAMVKRAYWGASWINTPVYREYQEQKNRQMSEALGLMNTAQQTAGSWVASPYRRRVPTSRVVGSIHRLDDKQFSRAADQLSTGMSNQMDQLRAPTPNLSNQPKQAKDPHFTPIIDRPDNIDRNRGAERAVSQRSEIRA